jgi:hypothetical protein
MKKKQFQDGGVIDEMDLYDDVTPTGAPGVTDVTPLAGEPIDLPDDDDDPDAGEPDEGLNTDLTGVERFLTAYGVQGGIITYEDNSTARFVDLDAEEQAEILRSLVLDNVPTVEEKYNLEDAEIDFLNALRESNLEPDEFINNLVARRAQILDAQREAEVLDYSEISDDALFIFQLQEANPNITDEEIEKELDTAKSLASYANTVNILRKSLIAEQTQMLEASSKEQAAAFQEELEAQRTLIVRTAEDIDSIGGARITPAMKEYLLHDILELNDNADPILMEKLFSDPETLFKANWFINYGEAYMGEIDAYWRNEVSKARKEGYMQATNGMPGVPTNLPGKFVAPPKGQTGAPGSFGRELSEEELFKDEK